ADGQTVTQDFTLDRAAATLSAVAVVGTRGEARTVIDAPAPIDVLTQADIKTSGRTETAQIIQMLAPSFNFPRTSIGDGTDHARPATLRGLGPDQVLVLVNGKRRHTSALVNLNGFVGRGTSGVDLNAIPASMIERIEVLRDGAAAQYGSDAIAGVINIVLKSGADGELATTAGGTNTEYSPGYEAHDGDVLQVGADYGLASAPNRFLHVGGEFRNRGYTNRTLPDPRQQYFNNDPRNLNVNLPTPARLNHRQGDAATRDVVGFFNAATPLDAGMSAYVFGGVGRRDGEAAGFFRRPQDVRTVRRINPDGFLPLIQSDIWDASGAVGIKGELRGATWDLSTTHGISSFGFNVDQSNNVSMGLASPTHFYAGTLRFRQSTTNLDLFREFHPGALPAVRAAAGGEFRAENYRILRGDAASYIDGGVRVLDGPDSNAIAAAGAQVFPGFRPSDEKDAWRKTTAGYVDLESDITSKLLLGVAGRAEHYTDFGSTLTGKVSGRFTLLPGYAVRGTYGKGFRAPSLGQTYFSSTATNFIGGVPFEIKTLPVSDPVAVALGAKPLRPETSHNLGAGVALEPLRNLALTVDYYGIWITDRIVLSDNFISPAVRTFLQNQGIPGAGGGRFFTNAINTKTNGVDVVANYGFDFARYGLLRLTAGYNHTRNRVTKVVTPTPKELGDLSEVLFGRVERARIEVGQPRDNLLFSATQTVRRLTINARAQRFGEVTSLGTDSLRVVGGAPNPRFTDQTFGAKWITDLSAGYGLAERFTVTVGADNIFDVYPDRNNNNGVVSAGLGGNANFGIFPYSGISPFGFNGRFVYVRATYGL
ncbi:MAG TPA: TonB-dependent receptor, partial [Gemmatimonadaceae bacterium]|nr:TonB-dependent receptor [Gemmatimonadaceae bacterium]